LRTISELKKVKMPEISRFFGILVEMRFDDIGQHNKSHIHVKYAEYKAVFALDGEILAGSFPNKQTNQTFTGLVDNARRRIICSLE